MYLKGKSKLKRQETSLILYSRKLVKNLEKDVKVPKCAALIKPFLSCITIARPEIRTAKVWVSFL